jgi:hypothetical protein
LGACVVGVSAQAQRSNPVHRLDRFDRISVRRRDFRCRGVRQ